MMALQMHNEEIADHVASRVQMLERALRPFVDEMRLMECGDLFLHVAREQFANLDDLIQSSLELIYQPGAFAFGWGATMIVGWREMSGVALDMEFCFHGVTVFFVLTLTSDRHHVELRCVSFGDPSSHPCENTRRLQQALAAAVIAQQASDKAA